MKVPLRGHFGKGRFALVDRKDYKNVMRYKWYAVPRADGPENGFYAVTAGPLYLHRLILVGAKRVDHKNGNTLDCRRCNLRVATAQQNARNMRKQVRRTSSQFKGVFDAAYGRKLKRPWRTRVHLDYGAIHIGYFATEKEAALAYDQAARKYFGEFARVNFPTRGETPASNANRLEGL